MSRARRGRLGVRLGALLTVTSLGLICIVQGDEAPGLGDRSVGELQRLMARGDLTSVDLVRALTQRIDRRDGRLRAVLAIDPDASRHAERLDREREAGELRGPLHGIPILLKDNIEADGSVPTTAGSLALEDNVTGRDAFLVHKLREAGAVILGKANLSEWANFRSERSASGWSAVGGQTRNPYDPTRTPCGSSSGSAVAVAAHLAPLAVGTETNGSIVCPASVNGVVGIKPTVGLISRFGIVPISRSQDTAGPFGRSVRDAVILLEAMLGRDEEDPATSIAQRAAGWSLCDHLREDGLKGKRIGVVRSLTGFHSEVDALFDEAIDDLRQSGAVIVDDLSLEPPPELSGAAYDVLLYEFKHGLDAYFAGLPRRAPARNLTLERLIAFNRRHAEQELAYFGQEIFVKAQSKGDLEAKEYRQALRRVRQVTRREGIDRLVGAHELDALIGPTSSPAWKIDLINGDHFLGGSSSYPARAGYPHITVPMGQIHGLPVGISFFGPALSEPVLIEVSYAYEQATHHHAPPR